MTMPTDSAAVLRHRDTNEAVDLGVKMVQQWGASLWALWFIVSLPLALLCFILVLEGYFWGTLLFWWFKPIFDTPLLHYCGQRFFNPDVTTRSILKDVWPMLSKDFFAKLMIRRFSITRSFDLAVSELEKLSGIPRNRRLNTLHRDSSATAIWLTLICFSLEFLLVLGALALAWLLLPEYAEGSVYLLDIIRSNSINITAFVLFYFAHGLIAPYYVACGYSLYINRRTALEAWDIELVFKRMGAELATSTKRLLSVGAITLLIAGTYWQSGPAHADSNHIDASNQTNQVQQPAVEGYSTADSTHDILEITESDAFNNIQEKEVIRPIFKWDDPDLKPDESNELAEWFASLFSDLAPYFEIIAWALAAAGVLYLAFQLRHLVKGVSRKDLAPQPLPPKVMFGLDVTGAQLPDDIVSAAQTAWQQKQHREAYSLLFRGALYHVIHVQQIPLQESYTEQECVEAVMGKEESVSALFFAQLTKQWQELAYGDKIPSQGNFESTCEAWSFHFGNNAHGAVEAGGVTDGS